MNEKMKRVLFWAPRALSILFAVFLSLFAFDVFGGEYGFWESIGAFMIHLAPVYMVIIALVIAWKWEWVGAALYFGLAIFYVVMSKGRMHWSAYAAICGSLVVIGGLFLVNWKYKDELKIR